MGNRTLFFNFQEVEKLANTSSEIIKILESFYTKPSISKFNLKQIYGSSFILNPTPLFKNKSIDKQYIVQYIKLASKRDYFMYSQYGIKSLQRSFYPDLNISAIKHNPLLKITEKEIIFLYE